MGARSARGAAGPVVPTRGGKARGGPVGISTAGTILGGNRLHLTQNPITAGQAVQQPNMRGPARRQPGHEKHLRRQETATSRFGRDGRNGTSRNQIPYFRKNPVRIDRHETFRW